MFDNIRKHADFQTDLNHFRIHKQNLYEDKDGFIWDDRNEFKKNAKLYDVVKIVKDESDDGYLIIYAINDRQEENLLKSFSSVIDELVTEHTSNPKIQTIIFNLISQALPKNDFTLIPVNRCFVIQKYLTLIPQSISIAPLYPPPRFV
jgi:hypothetical protein